MSRYMNNNICNIVYFHLEKEYICTVSSKEYYANVCAGCTTTAVVIQLVDWRCAWVFFDILVLKLCLLLTESNPTMMNDV